MRKNPRLEVKQSKHILRIILTCVSVMVGVIIIACLLFFPVWPIEVTKMNFDDTVSLKMDGQDKQVTVKAFNNRTAEPEDDQVRITDSLNAYESINITIENKSFDFTATDPELGKQRYYVDGWSYADLDRDGNQEILVTISSLINDGPQGDWVVFRFKDDEVKEAQRIVKGDLRRSLFVGNMSSTYTLMRPTAPTATVFFKLDF